MSERLFDPAVEASTVIDILRWRGSEQPDRIAYTFLRDGTVEDGHLTYGELDRRARAIGAALRSSAAVGERALLLYPQGREFIAAFFGCLYAGIIAIPAYPPRSNKGGSKLHAIARDARPLVALTTSENLTRAQAHFVAEPDLPPLRLLATDKPAGDFAGEWQPPEVKGATLAYLQYTSGSTSAPKGVMVSHDNLKHNLLDLDQGWEHTPESIAVTWLPTFHDMGLVYGIIEPLYRGFRCFVMPPVSFIQRPIRWLRAISERGATHSVAPNFAYELCIRKVKPEERAGLNLSRWSVAVNGAEPVRRETLERFAAAFEPCGFRWSAFSPGYGLAESTLKVCATRKTEAPVVVTINAGALEKHQVVEAPSSYQGGRTFVGCGRATLETKVAIVHPESLTRCPPDQVGEIWVSGPSVAQGYWNRPAETAAVFKAFLADSGEGPFLRTGDLGFLKDGHLFVTGRLKDMIIIRGQNHYPQDIELTAEQSHPALRPGCSIAFSIEAAGEERLIVAQEVERDYKNLNRDELVEAIRQAVAEEHEVQVYAVVLLRPGGIPKTSSGKVQRQACRAAYLAGSLDTWEKPADAGRAQNQQAASK